MSGGMRYFFKTFVGYIYFPKNEIFHLTRVPYGLLEIRYLIEPTDNHKNNVFVVILSFILVNADPDKPQG